MGSGRPNVVLLVKEDGLREELAGVLGGAGFAVIAAAEPGADLAWLDMAPLDLAVVDLDLAGERRRDELIRRARRRRPRLKLLFLTRARERPIADNWRIDFAAKPVAAREFLGCVLELLLREEEEGVSRRFLAELALAEAHMACLRRRIAAAAARGDRALVLDLDRDLDRARAAVRGLRAATASQVAARLERSPSRPGPPARNGTSLRRRP